MPTCDYLDRDGDLIALYLDQLRLRRYSPRSIRTYRSTLVGAHRQLPEGLPRASAPELLHWAGAARTTATQQSRTTIATQFFRWAIHERHLDFDPTAGLPRPRTEHRIPDVPADEQVHLALTATPADVRLWSVLAAYAGARRIEIARLRREHIGEYVRLRGKRNKDRQVPTHPLVAEAVDGLPPGPITDLTDAQIGGRARYQYYQVGADISIHRLRAWFANTMLQSGVDLATVQDLLGHEDPATTRRYATPSGQQYRQAIAALTVLGATDAAPAAARPPDPAPAGRT